MPLILTIALGVALAPLIEFLLMVVGATAIALFAAIESAVSRLTDGARNAVSSIQRRIRAILRVAQNLVRG